MPLPAIAHALPYVNWMLLTCLAAGTLAFVVAAGALTEATRGYLRFTAVCAAALAGLALLADFGLPPPADALAISAASAELDLLRRVALAAFTLIAIAYAARTRADHRPTLVGLAGIVAAAIALVAAAAGWAPAPAHAVPLLLQLVLLSAASGGALAALILGHWYLVTPRLSVHPLVLLTRALALVIALQLAVFAVWAAFGGGPQQGPFEALFGGQAFFGWLRLAVSLAFPLVLVAMAYQTARTRSMESATGLLYICVAAVLAGTIGAAALYVTAGVLV